MTSRRLDHCNSLLLLQHSPLQPRQFHSLCDVTTDVIRYATWHHAPSKLKTDRSACSLTIGLRRVVHFRSALTRLALSKVTGSAAVNLTEMSKEGRGRSNPPRNKNSGYGFEEKQWCWNYDVPVTTLRGRVLMTVAVIRRAAVLTELWNNTKCIYDASIESTDRHQSWKTLHTDSNKLRSNRTVERSDLWGNRVDLNLFVKRISQIEMHCMLAAIWRKIASTTLNSFHTNN